MSDHEVKQGEHITRIAHQYHFANFKTVWDDPLNKALKEVRKNPHILLPGDVVRIPAREMRIEDAATGQRHTFEGDLTVLLLKIRMIDYQREAVAGAECRLEIEGAAETLTSDGDGKIEKRIDPPDEMAKLTVSDAEYSIRIGHLDPVEEESGLAARLNNLGYHVPPADERDDDELKSSIEEFQCDFKMKVDGENDAELRGQVVDEHGS
jgi:hypothetical protein